jgi:alginate O-acetyltransferase complex protein AlgI
VFLFVFLPIVLVGYAAVAATGRRLPVLLWIGGVSLFFYAYWNPPYLALLVGSIVANYAIGNVLLSRRSRLILVAGIGLNLSLLVYFKYMNFFVGTLNSVLGQDLPVPGVVLPLAISFFTFQQIAYLADVYQGRVEDTRLENYVLFVTFFPHLIAGPILHHSQIIPQFAGRKAWGFRSAEVAAGLTMFIIGLQKKVVIADGIGIHAETLFDHKAALSPHFFESWIGTLAYAFHIYFDFSGYTDMALGLALLFGIRLPENFNSPYKARNIIDFWRRWHMTLSRFLRDYLYIPLGGNRRGPIRRYANLMITMLLGGLWHGAAWTFVFWGTLHGVFLVINHLWHAARRRMGHDLDRSTVWGAALARIVTMLAVIVAWVFFRSSSFGDALAVLRGMAGFNGIESLAPNQIELLLWLAVLAAWVSFLPNTQQLVGTRPWSSENFRLVFGVRIPVAPAVAVLGGVSLLVVLARGSDANNFIYMVF